MLVSAVAAVELVALIGAGLVLLAKPVAHHVQAAAVARAFAPARASARKLMGADSPVGPAKLARRQTSVLVLNGSSRSGAAAGTASRLHRLGYAIGGVGNAPHRGEARTVVMYGPGYRAEGERLGRDLHVRIVGPLDGLRLADLRGAHAVVVLGGR
jgi:hypothetical protein